MLHANDQNLPDRRRKRRTVPLVALGVASAALIGVSAAVASRAAEADMVTRHRAAASPFPAWPAADNAALGPTNPAIELLFKTGDAQTVEQLLVRAGADATEAKSAAALIDASHPTLPAGADVSIFLADSTLRGRPSVERVAVRASLGVLLTVARGADGKLRLVTDQVPVTESIRRAQGEVGNSLYWSLRAAGVEAAPASEFIDALGAQGSRAPAGADRFELVFDRRQAADGKANASSLQYAAIHRASGERTELVRWTVDGRAALIDPRDWRARERRLAMPLEGVVTSRFGTRVHPIFRTTRFHRGVDIRARWGTPVLAPADGIVTGAGWSGGYGVRVRLAHGRGLATSYSHLSRKAVSPGQVVRRGELIGYVGSTGFSTGAHLHYELFRNNAAVDPLSAAIANPATASRTDRAILAARIDQLRAVPVT